MPIIRNRPNLSVFKHTSLYREIKAAVGQPPNSAIPNDCWSIEKFLIDRENGIGLSRHGISTGADCRRISNNYIPNHKKQRIMSLESKVFCGTFNKDGSKFITASQDNIIRVYDSSKGTYHRINRIQARDVSWCILDIDFSPDGAQFVYSTWSHFLKIASVLGPGDDFQWLHINPINLRSCIFCVRFSPCGKFLIAGANDGCIYLCDRELGRRVTRVQYDANHSVDINAVSYVGNSPNLIVSGCDNGMIKLWDLRCLESRHEPVGMYAGHLDGITYINSRGDDFFILSNSKDQSIKIWDLRHPSPAQSTQFMSRHTRPINWDYRWDNVPDEFYNPVRELDSDCSVMTYRGHRVTKSLLRAKFSPAEQTGQRFIYTGCGTGRVIIYDVLTGHIKEAIEGHKDIVRDVAWHPVRSEIVSSSWDSHVNLNVFKHTFKRSHSMRSRNYNGEDDQPLRRSRRIALRNAET